ncbi:MAG: hypothetical protein DHS20C14_04410 [Phycisphaeraceae bacterium]|nr:MAG: hypothetical protein DHS20C14_04410 [Phycisphaeraceae bacterium]
MNEPIVIRTLLPADPPHAAAEIYERAGEGLVFGAPGPDDLTRLAGNDTTRVLVAEYSKTIIGAAIVGFPADDELLRAVPWFGRDDMGVMSRIAVEPALRGMGVASALIARCELDARDRGAANLGCALSPDHAKLIPLFERRGYTPVARVERGFEHLTIMSKMLAGNAALAA